MRLCKTDDSKSFTSLGPAAAHSHMDSPLSQAFANVDKRLIDLGRILASHGSLKLNATVEQGIDMITTLLLAYITDLGDRSVPEPDADILDIFKVLIKGDPSWNTIRDNCRELVYYRNCIAMNRLDALPPVAEKMALRTTRHVYLFMKTRAMREGRL